jgi:peptidoglycan hydrolase CwlO-like protein
MHRYVRIGLIIIVVYIIAQAWCTMPVVEGAQNKYNPNNENLSTKVQTNSGNIQYIEEHVKKIAPLEKHVGDIQTNVDKLNQQMANIKSAQTNRANKAQKATSKPVTGLH